MGHGRAGDSRCRTDGILPVTKLSHLGSPSLPAPLLLRKGPSRPPCWSVESPQGCSSGLPQGHGPGWTPSWRSWCSREAP